MIIKGNQMHIMTTRGWKPLRPSYVVPAPHDKTLLEMMGVSNPEPMDLAEYDKICHRRELPKEDPMSIDDIIFWRLFKAL